MIKAILEKDYHFVFMIIIQLIIFFSPNFTFADNKTLPLPRFASIKSNEVNARAGPSIRSPIEWVFVKKWEPVEITAEYEQWRLIQDLKGEGGWVHSSVLCGKRSVVIIAKEELSLNKEPKANSKVVVKVCPEVRCKLKKCKELWCKINCKNYEGWTLKKNLYGVYEKEVF